MADWRQIHARIRKAKASSDPSGQLINLYERTRDAMVAFELAQWHEKAEATEEAIRWYTTAAEHFRRAQWRTKAEEALTRLGAPIPVYAQPAPPDAKPAKSDESAPPEDMETAAAQQAEQAESDAAEEETPEAETAATAAAGPEETAEAATGDKKRRRRGRRGGRNRRRGTRAGETATPTAESPAATRSVSALRASAAPAAPAIPVTPRSLPARPAAEPEWEQEQAATHERSSEPAGAPSWQGRSRAGEPALASRIAQLESQLRRLLACPLALLEEADQAPAGPGVLLLSDSDQVTHYYVEACQTLRIAIGNLLRGGRGSKEGGRLKERMAENLGIGESRVSRYLKDHCAVRWIQLDEGAPEMAHFAMAVLRPVANE